MAGMRGFEMHCNEAGLPSGENFARADQSLIDDGKPNPHRTSGKDAFRMMFLESKKDSPADNVFVPVRYFHC
jgi:hypothetical protein